MSVPCIERDPLELSPEELDKLNIEDCVWRYYREVLRKRPRRKSYWQKEMEYRERVMRVLEELEFYRKR